MSFIKLPSGLQASKATIVIMVAAFCLLALLRQGNSHEPITTSVTFNKEIVRIFQQSCLACHKVNGLVGDIPLMNYEQARPWAKAIKEEVLEKRMPPFQAVKGYGSFQNGYFLAQRDIELIVSWVEGGAPRGKPEDLPREIVPAPSWAFGQPDLNLQPGQMIVIPSGAGEETRCVRLPTRLLQARRIHALDFRPGTSAVLAAEFAIERQGSNCNGAIIGSWVPGQAAIELPEATGFALPANATIVMKLRYRKSEQETRDHSILGVYFAPDENIRAARTIVITPLVTVIPAGAAQHRLRASYLFKEATEALSVRPLLYPLGRSVEVTAFRPDGTAEVLALVKGYRYNWQPGYYFKNPVVLPAGTRLEVTAYLDNSDRNTNLSDGIPKTMKFADPLCQLLVAKAAGRKSAAGKTQMVADSSSVHLI